MFSIWGKIKEGLSSIFIPLTLFMPLFTKKIGNNHYVRCKKCGMIRNVDLAPKCPVCKRNKLREEITKNPKSVISVYRRTVKYRKTLLTG